MRRDLGDVLEIVGALHEGVADPGAWTRGLDGVGIHLNVSTLIIGTIIAGRLGFDMEGHRLEPEALARIIGPLANATDNPWVAAVPRLPLRRPVTVDDIGGRDVLTRSALWRDVHVAFDGPWAMGAVLERQAERSDIIMAARSAAKPDFDRRELARLGDLIPHIARAYRVRRELAAVRYHAEGVTCALDALDRGVILTAPDGTIRYANRAAERALSADDGIGSDRGRLRGARHRDTATLRTLIHEAARTGIGQGMAAIDAMALPRPSARRPLAIVAEPLSPAHGEALDARTAHGAILFIGADRDSRPPVERLALVYGLTQTEARIASRIAAGDSVAEAARALGVAENTAKTHVKAVYEKIGVTRQTHLIRRIYADLGGLALGSSPARRE